MAKKKKSKEEDVLTIDPINKKLMQIGVKAIQGSTLITHRLPPEKVEEFTARERGKSKKKKKRDLDKEYEDSFYYTEDGEYGIPAAAFMAAMLDASVAQDIAKTEIKRSVRILGEILPLKYDEVRRRKDVVRRSGRNRTPDIRHRPEFVNWSTNLYIQYDANQITPEQIVNLVNAAGFSCGVGDWRPNAPKSSGTHGMFEVDPDAVKAKRKLPKHIKRDKTKK